MKKMFTMLLLCVVLLVGCSTHSEAVPTSEAAQIQMQIANPWKSYDSMDAAKAASGLDFPLPDLVAEIYAAETYRVMNGQLMEVVYRNGDDQVIVRMQTGEDQDISGVYGQADSTETTEIGGTTITTTYMGTACIHLIYGNGTSFSLYAPNGYQGDACSIFLSYICAQ